MRKTTRFKELILAEEILMLPGAYDAFTAKIIENAGFQALTMGGYSVAASHLGEPDVGYLSLTEMVNQAKTIADATTIPLFADGDTGYGNALSVMRAVREFEKAGAAGVFFEDQEWPKRCGHMEGKRVIPVEEHVNKIKAAVAARQDPDFIIMARTDARAVNGLEDAINRAKAYREAGADLIFVEAPQSIEELKTIAQSIDAPQMVNVIEHGKTPSLPAKEYQKMGFSVVTFPLSAIYSVAKVLTELMREIYETGTSKGFENRMIPFTEFNKLIGLPYYRELEERYLTNDVLRSKYGNEENLKRFKDEGR